MAETAFQEILLATDNEDDEAVLVLRDGRLAAVLSRLSDMHEDRAGSWFVEALFGGSPHVGQHMFESPDEFARWLEHAGG